MKNWYGFFSDVKSWYQILTNVKKRYRIVARVKNRYQILTSVKNWYQIVTYKNLIINHHTCEELVPILTCENWYQIITDVKNLYLIVADVIEKTVTNLYDFFFSIKDKMSGFAKHLIVCVYATNFV